MYNASTTILASAVRAATVTGTSQTNLKYTGLHLIVDVTVVPGVDTVTPKIQGYDQASDKWYDILVGAAIVATSTVVLRVCPGLAAVANLTTNDRLPPAWRVVMTHSAASNFTYSVGANLLL